MSMEESEELKCDREGYFDLDSMRPYSSVWVSTRRDVRPKSVTLEDTDNKKNVAPSRACNNLHSLLETTEGSPAIEECDEELAQQAQLSSTKSDQFPLNTYKKFEKNDGTSMKKISDKIIESMCKSDSSAVFNDGDSNRPMSQNSQMDECGQDDSLMPEAGEGEVEETCFDSAPTSKEKLYKEPSMTSHLGAGEPQEDPMAKGKLLTESGRLVTEMNLTALNIKDQTGREFPVTVKYVWETDANDVLNASENVFNASSGFVKIVDTVTTVGTKYENWDLTEGSGLLDKTVSWHENSKSQSSVGTKKRVEGCYPEGKESSQGSKGDAPTVRKGPLKDAHTIKHAPTRSKVSFVGPAQEKKNGPGDKKDARTDGNRAGSKINVADKKAADKKTRAPVKKKLSTGDDVKATGTTAARPATFNKREPTPRPAPNRPPSAPTKEVTKQPPRIAVQDSGDKLPANNGKRQFGSKFQAPANAAAAAAAAAAGGKFWK